MTEEAKKARREYKRNWQRQNRDKCKTYQQRYWEKQATKAAGDTTPQTV